jgi:hypothetical protein
VSLKFVFHKLCAFLAAANKAALAVAVAADLQFIRAEGFVFSHVADEGYQEPHIRNFDHFLKFKLAPYSFFLSVFHKYSNEQRATL